MTPDDWSLLGFTTQIALVATALGVVPGTLLAAWLSRSRGSWATFVEVWLSLPLVLPPTAMGLFLLELFRSDGPLGSLGLLFTPSAVVVAAFVMSFPLLVRTARAGFESVDPRLIALARSLGASPRRAFFRVALPLAAPGILAGTLLSFSRALGEFGATILIAGNIPGRTQTLALALFQRAQLGDDAGALRLAGLAVALSVVAVTLTEWLSRKSRRVQWR